MRPVIGITCYVEPVDRGVWRGSRSSVLPQSYVEQVQAAGGIALLIPPRLDADAELAAAICSRIDGLILAGGPDVDARRYGATPAATNDDPRPDRDGLELALARASAKAGMPLLGICRGMQVMAVAAGGRLIQHLPDVVGHHEHGRVRGEMGVHRVHVNPHSRLAALLGTECPVSTYHHQAVATHPGYLAAAHASDGTIEAIEDPAATFRLGVQWHPEVGSDPRLFEALLSAASVALPIR